MKADIPEAPKMAAAISAVYSYIRLQEEAAAQSLMQPTAVEPPAAPARPAAPIKLWGISGRQDMMSLRNLMQLRTFQGSKLR